MVVTKVVYLVGKKVEKWVALWGRCWADWMVELKVVLLVVGLEKTKVALWDV